MLMLAWILIGLQSFSIIMFVIFFIRQFIFFNRYQNNHHDASTKLDQLTKESQTYQQQLREALLIQMNQLEKQLLERLGNAELQQSQHRAQLKEQLQDAFSKHRYAFDERQLESLKILNDTLQKGVQDNRQQVKDSLFEYSKELGQRINQLTQATETKLKEINQQVEKRLTEGFQKNHETFSDVIKRLALIDAAQQKITELSNNVMSLQEILSDKRSRGAFGEVQLSGLVHNMLPEQHFSLQYELSNKKRVDCILFLPEPSGHIAIDAKFPLENYRILINSALSETEKKQAEKQFKLDIRKHIQDIAEKYIIPGETADGAVMFIPAEAVFAEIHARHSDLVEFAQQSKVWMVSPTTLMAVLSTARAVLKDAATRKQVHEIQQHLRVLGDDFRRFQLRMDNLATHIAQAHHDVEQVHISSRKITQRFVQIEKAEVEPVILPQEEPLSLTTGRVT